MSEQQKYSIFERILAYTAAIIILISVASFITTLIVAMVGGREVLAQGLWQFVTFMSYVGLPVGFLLVVALLGINFTRRGRNK